MAVTRKQQANEQYKPGEQVQQAQTQMQQVQSQQPAAYQPSEQVTQAQAALQQNQMAKPQTYSSKYGQQLDNILQQIQNPKQFKYEFNGDELFKYYADLYTQKGKQASADAMGQAAALTGGYGNSYGQQVANQTYDQYLLNLYDKGMEMRDRAYQQYRDELANQQNIYNILANADATDYGRYRDTVADWGDERDYLANRADVERNYDYNLYRDLVGDWERNRDYYTNQYNNAQQMDYNMYQDARNFAEQQYQYDAQLEENIRQFNESLDWDKMSAQQKYAAEYALAILQNGQMPTEELLRQAGLSAADAQKLIKKVTGGGRKTAEDPTNVFYTETDANGNNKYYVLESDAKGNRIKVDVPDYVVKNNDLVRNFFTEGASRKKLNQTQYGASAAETEARVNAYIDEQKEKARQRNNQ